MRKQSISFIRTILAIGILLAVGAGPSQASHVRYLNLSWAPTGTPNQVKFDLTMGFQRAFPVNNAEGDPSGFHGSASDGFAQTGDIITDSIGQTFFDFGYADNLGNEFVTLQLKFVVTSYSITGNWIIAQALDPVMNTPGILWTYPGPGPYLANVDNCCRIATNLDNRAFGEYRVESIVLPSAGFGSPVSTMEPIVSVMQGTTSTFQVPAADPYGHTLRWRLSTDNEAGHANPITTIDGPPPNFSIDPNTGVVTWNTALLDTTNFWTVQITIESLDANGNVLSKTPVDFLLQIIPSNADHPPVCTATPIAPYTVTAGSPLSFTIEGTDPDRINPTTNTPEMVTVNGFGLPTGASLSQPLPITGLGGTGNMVSTTFNWTPTTSQLGTYVLQFSATDLSMEQSFCDITIHVVASVAPPTINCGPAITQNNDPGQCSAKVTVTPPTAFDGTGAPITPVGVRSDGALMTAPFAVGTTSITWTATAANGASATCKQMVTVVDVASPVITCPGNVTVSTDPGKCGAVVRFNVTATDNCGATVTSTPPSGSLFPVGTTTVISTAVDMHGNMAACSFAVTVQDKEPPHITAPANVQVNADPGQCTAGSVLLGTPVATDNCTLAGVTNDAPAKFPVGATTVTWTATDASGNSSQATQTVTVTDNQPPVLGAAPNVTVPNDPGMCGAVVTFPTPTATDNCGSATVTCNPASGTQFPLGATTVVCTATDLHGNVSTGSFTVTVLNENVPILGPVADILTHADLGQCTATVSLPPVTATDGCGAVLAVVGARSDGKLLTDPYPIGTTTILWTATAANGKSGSTTQRVTVQVNAGGRVTCTTAVSDLWPPNHRMVDVGLATSATDLCGDALPVCVHVYRSTQDLDDDHDNNARSGDDPLGPDAQLAQLPNGQYQLLLRAERNGNNDDGRVYLIVATTMDRFGNVYVHGSTVTVTHDQSSASEQQVANAAAAALAYLQQTGAPPSDYLLVGALQPSITCPPDVTVTAGPGACSASVSVGTATATDDCDSVSVVGSRSDGKALTDAYPVGITTILWTATNGPASVTCVQTVTVKSSPQPIIACNENVTVSNDSGQCSARVHVEAPRATVGCDANGDEDSHPNSDDGNGSKLSVVGTRSDGKALTDPYPVGTTTITWIATNGPGNSATCVQTITVQDKEKPEINCPEDVTVKAAGAAHSASVPITAPTASDNCSATTVTGARTDGKALTDPYPLGTTTILWTALDAAGNASHCSQQVTVTSSDDQQANSDKQHTGDGGSQTTGGGDDKSKTQGGQTTGGGDDKSKHAGSG